MKEERWQEILGMMKDKFEVIEEETVSEEDGHGQIHRVIVKTPLGKIKLERTKRDRTLGEKTIGSKRIGGDVQIEKIYSDSEQVNFLNAFKLNEETQAWTEIDPDKMGIS